MPCGGWVGKVGFRFEIVMLASPARSKTRHGSTLRAASLCFSRRSIPLCYSALGVWSRGRRRETETRRCTDALHVLHLPALANGLLMCRVFVKPSSPPGLSPPLSRPMPGAVPGDERRYGNDES